MTQAARSIGDQQQVRHLHDQIQIALAIADPVVLKAMLVHCRQPVTQLHLIGAIAATIGVTTQQQTVVDGIIEYEAIQCSLVPQVDAPQGWNARDYRRLTQCESDTISLGEGIPWHDADQLLTQAGYTVPQIHHILHLPKEGCYKSWWLLRDSDGQFTLPFLRLIRTLTFSNGTVTLRYKDYFERQKPPCFRTTSQRVLVEICPQPTSFSRLLTRINRHRAQVGIQPVVLICDEVSEFEAQGLISQGVSLYPAINLVLPTQAQCHQCTRATCPLQGTLHSPVTMCRDFAPVAT